jgi:hypothetical protein
LLSDENLEGKPEGFKKLAKINLQNIARILLMEDNAEIRL